MVISSSEERINRIKVLGLHGMSRHAWQRFSDAGFKHYFVEEAGFKYNMMDLQAAIGIHQLARVEENWRRRRGIWDRYLEAFKAMPVVLPAPRPRAPGMPATFFKSWWMKSRPGSRGTGFWTR
jgi:dTDP-4-amino-4,6-dideoxygalactose transaminase